MESVDSHNILKVSNFANCTPAKDSSVSSFTENILPGKMNHNLKQKLTKNSRKNLEDQNNTSEIFEKKMKQLNITVGSKTTKLNLNSSIFSDSINNYLKLTKGRDIKEPNQQDGIGVLLQNSNDLLNQKTLKNYNHPDTESDQLELLSVLSILKICNDFEKNLVDWTSLDEINSKFISILKIFEFYFLALKPSDPNFGLKKFIHIQTYN
ncbi:unnamed protein product [[Candida] boidinii]|nr:unnamed protein product [[Candida] boidinii]